MTALFDVDDVREQFPNRVFDEQRFRLTSAQIADYAAACGEQAPRYTDPDHPCGGS